MRSVHVIDRMVFEERRDSLRLARLDWRRLRWLILALFCGASALVFGIELWVLVARGH